MNETDKTLLEMAAKAAEIGLQWDRMSNVPCLAYSNDKWNPLQNIGQAAELALLLDIDITWLGKKSVVAEAAEGFGTRSESYTNAASKRLAYCRAVTRAAATAGMYKGK